MMNHILSSLAAWIRRPQVWGFAVAVAVMAAVSLAFFYPDNVEGASLQQADMVQGAANGHQTQAFLEQTGHKPLWTDALMGGMPTFQISPSYPSNSLFQWIDTVYSLGLPSPSNLLFMMMLGMLIMLYCLGLRWPYALVGALAWGLSSYYVIIIGAGHIWKFLALAYVPPTVGGLILAYRGRLLGGAALTAMAAMMQLGANHPQMTYYSGFIMAGVALANLAAAARERRLRRWCAATAVCVGAGALAVGANLPNLYNTYEYAKFTKRAGSELTPLQGDQAAADAAAPAQEDRPTGGMPYAEIVGWSYGGSESFSLLIPNIKGGATARPEHGSMVLASLDRLDAAADYAGTPAGQVLGQFPQYFNDSEGTNGPVYVGAVIAALFLLGCIVVRGPLKWALLALTVMSVLLAMGRNLDGLTQAMVYHFPLYNRFRAVESILVIAQWTMPVLAVLALSQVLEAPAADRWRLYWRPVCVAFGIAGGVCLLALAAPSLWGSAVTEAERQVLTPYPDIYQAVESLRLGMVRQDALRSLVFILGAWGLLAGALNGRLRTWMGLSGIGALVLVDLYGVDKRYVDHSSFADPVLSVADPLAADALDRQILAADTTVHYRVMDIPGFGDPRRSYYHSMVGGYHAAKLSRYEDLIQRRLRHVLSLGYDEGLRSDSAYALVPANQHHVLRGLQADYRVLDMLNARWVIDGGHDGLPLRAVPNPHALGHAWLVDNVEYVPTADAEMAALDTLDTRRRAVASASFEGVLGHDRYVAAAGDTVVLDSYALDRLEYTARLSAPAVAVFSEVYFPWGWNVTVDGRPASLGRVNYVLRALRLPAGDHCVVMAFDPQSIHVTSTVAYICVTVIYLLLLAALGVAAMRRRRSAPGQSPRS